MCAAADEGAGPRGAGDLDESVGVGSVGVGSVGVGSVGVGSVGHGTDRPVLRAGATPFTLPRGPMGEIRAKRRDPKVPPSHVGPEAVGPAGVPGNRGPSDQMS